MSRDIEVITLIHSNDLHSHLEEASQIAGYIRKVRENKNEEQVLLLDCGDFLDRVRLETEGTNGAVNRAILESMGYDAVLLGNNEGLSYSVEELEWLFSEMTMPVVCANMVLKETGQCPSWMVPAKIIMKSGIRIGLIGVTVPYLDYYKLLGWNAWDPMEVVQKEVNLLRAKVDILIVMSHLGLRQDKRMASTIEGIHLILGGHTHHLLEAPLEIEKTTIAAAGKFGDYLGHLELTFDSNSKELLHITGGSIPTEGMDSDPDVDRIIREHHLQAKDKMSRQIAILNEPLDWKYDKESPLSNLLACAVRSKTAAQISLVNTGQLLQGLHAGPVTEEEIHSICPSPINLCVMKLHGHQILRVLEESLLAEFYELEIRGFGFRGHVLGALCIDGMEITIDPSALPYHRIIEARIQGERLDPSCIYSVGTLDMFTFGVGYVGLKEGWSIQYFLPEYIREILIQALNEEEWIKNCYSPRILMSSYSE